MDIRDGTPQDTDLLFRGMREQIAACHRLIRSEDFQILREAFLADAALVEQQLIEGLANEDANDIGALVLAKNRASRLLLLRNFASAPQIMAQRLEKEIDELAKRSKKEAEIAEMRRSGEPIVPGGNV